MLPMEFSTDFTNISYNNKELDCSVIDLECAQTQNVAPPSFSYYTTPDQNTCLIPSSVIEAKPESYPTLPLGAKLSATIFGFMLAELYQHKLANSQTLLASAGLLNSADWIHNTLPYLVEFLNVWTHLATIHKTSEDVFAQITAKGSPEQIKGLKIFKTMMQQLEFGKGGTAFLATVLANESLTSNAQHQAVLKKMISDLAVNDSWFATAQSLNDLYLVQRAYSGQAQQNQLQLQKLPAFQATLKLFDPKQLAMLLAGFGVIKASMWTAQIARTASVGTLESSSRLAYRAKQVYELALGTGVVTTGFLGLQSLTTSKPEELWTSEHFANSFVQNFLMFGLAEFSLALFTAPAQNLLASQKFLEPATTLRLSSATPHAVALGGTVAGVKAAESITPNRLNSQPHELGWGEMAVMLGLSAMQMRAMKARPTSAPSKDPRESTIRIKDGIHFPPYTLEQSNLLKKAMVDLNVTASHPISFEFNPGATEPMFANKMTITLSGSEFDKLFGYIAPKGWTVLGKKGPSHSASAINYTVDGTMVVYREAPPPNPVKFLNSRANNPVRKGTEVRLDWLD